MSDWPRATLGGCVIGAALVAGEDVPAAIAHYVLDASALALVGATARPLALDAAALGRSFGGLRAEAVRPRAYGGDGPTGVSGGEIGQMVVGLVSVRGPLAQRAYFDDELCAVVDGYDAICERFAEALEASESVVLVIDSPGGDGAGLLEAVRRMRAMADEADKPVVAYIDEQAASAAYWIAAGVADEVLVPEMGAVGSIGAIAVHCDISKAAEDAGVKYSIIRDPAGKAAGISLEPLGDLGRARIEREVGALADAFVNAMAERRGLDGDAVRAMNADCYRGVAAVRAGLADGVATFEQASASAAARASERTDQMSVKAALGQLVKAPATATDDALERGAAAAEPIMNLGRVTLALAGTSDPNEAMRSVSAWKAAFDAAAAEKPKKAAKKDAKRVALLREAVVVGLLQPQFIKIDTSLEISIANTHAHLREMPIDVLEGMVAQRRSLATMNEPSITRPDPASPHAPLSATALTDEERTYATRFGIDPRELAAHKALTAGKAN